MMSRIGADRWLSFNKTVAAKKLRWHAGIALAVVALVLLLDGAGGLQRVEWMSYDARMALTRVDATPHPDIAVVLIDEASLQAMDPVVGRFPWPREVYAELIEFLSFGGPRAVVFDMLFSEHQRDAEWAPGRAGYNDLRLAEATRDAGMVHHAVQFVRDQEDERNKDLLDRPLPEVFVARHALAAARDFSDAGNNGFALPIPELQGAAGGVGVVGIEPDADGVYRRVRLFTTYQGAVFPSLAIAPLRDGGPAIHPVRGGVRIGEMRVPLDREGFFPINLYGDIPAYSISGLFASLQRIRAGEIDDLLVHPDEFAGKIVFIGASAVGLADTKNSPIDPRLPGVMLHVSVTSNLLVGDMLRLAPAFWNVAAVFLLALLVAAAMLLVTNVYGHLLLPLLLAGGYAGWGFWRFSDQLVVDLAAPLTGAGLTWLGTLAFVAFSEGRDKRRVRQMLSTYVSPAILAEVVDKYQDQLRAEVGSQERVTVLFSDIRGFTNLSEGLPADRVVELLNFYFSAMTDVIFKHQGTLDKFIGDAIMAFWGAPLRDAAHADKAVHAAMEMIRVLEAVNAELGGRGYRPLRTGIGLNTGDVILGNIGSDKKLDYTIIGDNVNLASRAEGLTAKYGCPLIISEFTLKEVRADIPCALVDRVRVKGKQQSIAFYRPLALPGDPPEVRARAIALRDATAEAFELYAARRWQEALAGYAQLGDDPVAQIFQARCRRYLGSEPPAEWDGAHTLESK